MKCKIPHFGKCFKKPKHHPKHCKKPCVPFKMPPKNPCFDLTTALAMEPPFIG